HLQGMAVGVAEEGHIPDGRTSISRFIEEPPFPTRQRAQPLHVLPTRAGHAQVGGRDERMVDLTPFGEDDDKGAHCITHPRHLEPRRGYRPPVHHLHPCVRRVECDAVVEVAHRQGHMGQAAIDHHAPPLDCCIYCCSRWCTNMAKRYPGCRDPLRCTARTASSLMIRTTLAPKLGVQYQRRVVHTCFMPTAPPAALWPLADQPCQSPPYRYPLPRCSATPCRRWPGTTSPRRSTAAPWLRVVCQWRRPSVARSAALALRALHRGRERGAAHAQ